MPCRLGSLVFLIYLVAFCFYMWIRVTKTLDLGQFVAYGIAILVIEIMGATATVIYGLNLILMPVYEKFPDDPQNPGRPLVDVPYHIRVLIPCYKEPLEIVGRTATAALDAELPRTCQRTVYLLDDGKDPAKRKWCMQMGAESEPPSLSKQAVITPGLLYRLWFGVLLGCPWKLTTAQSLSTVTVS